MRLPTFADVEEAAARIAPLAVRTPLLESPVLDDRVGARVLLKLETLQRIGAFKFRGAYNKISRLDRREHPGGVVAASSGNHAQGVAEAARLCGLPAAIVMPADAPRIKVERTRALGAEVILYDREREDRDALAAAEAGRRRAALVPAFDDLHVMAGQGTAGLELMREAAGRGLMPEVVLAPCSGGGLVTGVALAVKAHAPDCRVHGVEPAGFDDFRRSLLSGRRERNTRLGGSICDALMQPTPGELPFAVGRGLLADGLAVGEEQVRSAVRFAFTELKLVVEPGGAAGLAALLAGLVPRPGRTMAVVLSGGNIDPALLSTILGSA